MNLLQLLKSTSTFRLSLHTFFLIVVCIIRECISYGFILKQAAIMQAVLGNPDHPTKSTFQQFIALIVAGSFNAWLLNLLTYKVEIIMRENMTRTCLTLLSASDHNRPLCDNADQRICEECLQLAEHLPGRFIPRMTVPILIVFYYVQGWRHSKLWYFPATIVSLFLVSATFTRLLVSRTTELKNVSSACEGNLRATFVNYLGYRSQASTANHHDIHIKLLHSLLSSATIASQNYKNLMSVLEGLIYLSFYAGAIVPFLLIWIATELNFYKAMSQNQLVEHIQVTIQLGIALASSCSKLLDLGDDCVIMVNSIRRIRGFLSSILQTETFQEKLSGQTSGALMLCPEQAVSTDDGSKILLGKVAICLDKGQSVLLVGKSGTGKSTIFQQIARSYRGEASETTLKIRWRPGVSSRFISCNVQPLPHLVVAKSAFFTGYLENLHPLLAELERKWFYLTVHGLMLVRVQEKPPHKWNPLIETFSTSLANFLQIFEILRELKLVQCSPVQVDLFSVVLKEKFKKILGLDPEPKSCFNCQMLDQPESGLETEYSQILGSLSSGEQQRLLFVSLLGLKQAPDVIFIDEATSHIDCEMERSILQNLIKRGSTLFQISHSNNNNDLFQSVITL